MTTLQVPFNVRLDVTKILNNVYFLSGDLVKWKAYLRTLRCLVDLGCFVLRIYLWITYDALSSVFLIKNLYNLLNTVAQIERSFGISKYLSGKTLFLEFVSAAEWYGMDKSKWMIETRQAGLFVDEER